MTHLSLSNQLIMFSQNQHNPNPYATQPKPIEPSIATHPLNPIDLTASKKPDLAPIYSQITPKPQRKILLYGENRSRHLFPLVRDRDIGISGAYQNVVFESVTSSPSR